MLESDEVSTNERCPGGTGAAGSVFLEQALTGWLNGMQARSDLSKVYGPKAAVMTPPLGLTLAATPFKDRFTPEERDAAKARRSCWASRSSSNARDSLRRPRSAAGGPWWPARS